MAGEVKAVKHRLDDSSAASEIAMSSLDERRRRAHYRAAHRGTREMDWLLGRYAEANLAIMSAADLEDFERLLEVPDPELHQWIIAGPGGSDGILARFIVAIRRFHGLETE